MKGDPVEKFKKLNKFRNIFIPIGFVVIGAMFIAYLVLNNDGYEHADSVLFAALMVTAVVLMLIYALNTISKNLAGYIVLMRKKAEKEAKEAKEAKKTANTKKTEKNTKGAKNRK